MTWWPSVPTRAVIAPTIAGSSSTTRIRSGRVVITMSGPSYRLEAPTRPPRGCGTSSEVLAHSVEILDAADVPVQHAVRVVAHREPEVHQADVLADHLPEPR